MKANNNKAIGNWLRDIEDGTLCLPRFQRRQVWSKQKVCQFLETLILDTKTPVGVFLVLSTDPSDPAFPPRTIQETFSKSETCNSLLLDGQQRLSALWKALNDEDDDFRYYIQFNNQFRVEGVKSSSKGGASEKARDQEPRKQYQKNWFPVKLLNPLLDEKEVDRWLQKLRLQKTNPGNHVSLRKLIIKTRKIFSRYQSGGKVIPYFQLPASTDRNSAINVYRTINTNLVRLSDHYLAVAAMEKETGESLYDMEKRLTDEVSLIKDLETDEIGELILKISCVLQGKKPSGGSYRSRDFDFNKVLDGEREIFKGVAWAVDKLGELKIWHGSQLPSVVPLRVLPAIYPHVPKLGPKLAIANKIIAKYLWHAFLTDRYDRQANDRLKEDYDNLEAYFQENKSKEDIIKILEEYGRPVKKELKDARWPGGKGRLPKGILLVCCHEGARTLASDELLTVDNYKQRERHHVFPKSKLSKNENGSGNNALNCLLIPKEDNRKYGNDLPGDYISKLFEDLGTPLPQVEVVDRLGTHLISRKSASKLVETTQNKIDSGQIILDSAYQKFLETRADDVEGKIGELLGG